MLETPYSPSGNTVAVWDFEKEKVIQLTDLGDTSGAIEADWLHAPSSSYGYAIGTSGNVWLWEDEDKNGFLDFHQVLSGLGAPCDMTLSRDDRYLYISNWLTNTVQQYNISAPYSPKMVGEAKVPHPCMMRLSPDGQRLYVTNSIMRTLDDDAEYGARNDQYGIYLLKVDIAEGGLSHATGEDTAWVDYSSIQKNTIVGRLDRT